MIPLIRRISSLITLILVLSAFEVMSSSVRTRGKFDRYGSTKNLHKAITYRNVDSKLYYHHPDGARIIKSSNFELDYELGRKIVFLCTAIGNPRPTITWFKDGIELEVHSWYRGWRSITEWKESDQRIKSKMEIDPAATMDRGEYECVADNKWALDRRRFRTDYVETQNPYFF